MQPPPALDERQTPQVGTVEPEKVEGHVTGRLLAPEKVNENRAAGLVDRDHLAVDYGLVDIEYGTICSPSASKRLKRLPLREMKRQQPCSR